MRRLHLLAGLLGALVFVLSGQVVRLHHPPTRSVEAGHRMMYMSRHVYILGNALVNLALGVYLILEHPGWGRNFQVLGSVLNLLSLVLLTSASVEEPGGGIAGRSLVSAFGWFTLLGGTLLHLFARPQREPRTQPN